MPNCSNRLLKYPFRRSPCGAFAGQSRHPSDQTDEPDMRGADTFTESLFTMRHLDDFVPAVRLPLKTGVLNPC